MVPLRKLLKGYTETGALGERLNLFGFLDETAFVTKSGDLGVVLRLRGVDAECREPEELDQRTRRFESAIRVFDERYVVYQYLVKRSNPELVGGGGQDPTLTEAVRRRLRHLNAKGANLYSFEGYLVILRKAAKKHLGVEARLRRFCQRPLMVLREAFSTESRMSILGEELDTARRDLRYRLESFLVQSEDALPAEVLSRKEAFSFFRRLLNPSPEKAASVGLKYDVFLDYFGADSELECHRGYLRLDDYYLKVLTLKDPPSRSFALVLGRLYEAECDFYLTSEWSVSTDRRAQRAIRSKRRHFHNTKVSLLSYLSTERPAEHEVLIDDSNEAIVNDLGSALEEMELAGRHFGEYSLSVVVFSKDLERVEHASSQFMKAIGAYDGALTEERYNLLNAFLATTPGNYNLNLRRLWLTDTNHADLSFLFLPDGGETTSRFLGQEHLLLLETLQRTPYYYNLHCDDVGHTLVLGATGSGKTFLLNNFVLNLQKYAPFTMILDMGGGYEWMTSLFGGSHLRIGAGKQPFTINPFSLAPTPENLHFLFSLVTVLIELGGHESLNGPESRELYQAIENVYVLDASERRLLTVSRMLPRHMAEHLSRWVQGGQFGDLFDNTEDTLTLARFQSFDLEGLDRYQQVLEPLLFYILFRASTVICDPAHTQDFKVCLVDEAWKFMRHPVTRDYITDALKTWRKKNAAMLLATQSTQDLLETDMVRHLAENCPTKVFLAHPNLDERAYSEVFSLTETEIGHIKRLVPKRQLLMKRPQSAKILELDVDPLTYWLCTSNPKESARRREAVRELGLHRGLEQLVREL